jgi:quercetin dioxygenase-like cupin family protein
MQGVPVGQPSALQAKIPRQGDKDMPINSSKAKLTSLIAVSLLVIGVVYAAVPLELWVGTSDHIGLWNGPSTLTARTLKTPVGETTGPWHYHPGYVYNVVRQGTITVEDGCGKVQSYSAGQAFETSQGRVHRAYNLGGADAIESNMFVGPPGRPITVFIPNNEGRCGPPSSVDECKGDGWASFDFPSQFTNQGQCVDFVNNRRRITLLVPEDPLS